MLGEVRQKLLDYNEWNKKCLLEARSRHDEKAIAFNENVIFAIEKALSFVDEAERNRDENG